MANRGSLTGAAALPLNRKHGAVCVVVAAVVFVFLRSDRHSTQTASWLLRLAETQAVNYVFHAKHTITR